MIRTEIATLEVIDDCFIRVKFDENSSHNLAQAREIVRASTSIAQGRRLPILVDSRKSVALDTETRHFYTGQELFRHFSALALVLEGSPMGRLRGNVYFRVAKPPIPVKLFSDSAAAEKWCREAAQRAGT